MLADPSPEPVDPPAQIRLRRDCRALARGAVVLCVVLAGLLALEDFGPWLTRPPTLAGAAASLLNAAPAAAFLVGLWLMGRSLGRFADQGRLSDAVGDGLRGVGVALIFGGLFQTAAAPGLKTALGNGPGYYLGLDAAAIVIAAIGAGLLVISRLLRRAAAMEAELDTIL